MVNKDWMTPYNTGKVKIGCMYVKPCVVHEMTVDGLRLQRALLMKHHTKPETTRMARAVKLFDVLVDKLARRK